MKKVSRALLATAAFCISGGANAAITVFTTQGSFNSAVTGAQVDTFNDLFSQNYNSPLNRTVGAYGYQISAADGLFPGSDAGNIFISTNRATNPLVFSNFTGGVSAIGGFFFGSDISGSPSFASAITLTVTDNTGSVIEVILNPNTSSFRGFTSTGTITSLSASTTQPSSGFVWPSADNLTLAQAVAGAVPEPGTWAMMILGFGVLGTAMRRRKGSAANLRLA
ncbi:PEPxxWA-CTERM sorting domain-containing protein [Qipengyuania sp.]|uniref:PEPxxWA-CTERM sorting domain-containing protein n=1 Tax=Qipengyuania sp. TaxID=2004515 RepID=UPI0035C8194C